MALRLVGVGVLSARLVSILAGTLLLVLVALYAKYALHFTTDATFGALLVLLLTPQFFIMFKIARPEMLVAFLGFASFVALEPVYRTRSTWWAATAGVLAGGAMLSHLYGAIFVAAGVVALLARRHFRAAAAFLGAALVTLVPYALDVARHRELFETQFHGVMAGRLTRFSPATPFINLLNEHKRLFRKPAIIFSSALFFATVLLGWRQASPRLRYLAGYVLFLMAALGALATRKEVHYATCFAPFEALVIVGTLSHLSALSRRREQALLVFTAMFGVCGAWFAGLEFQGKTHYEAMHQLMARPIPDGAWCLTPMPLLFNQVTRLNLVATMSLSASDSVHPRPFFASRHIQYVVSIDDDPGERALAAMEPLALLTEGAMDHHRYRVFAVMPRESAPAAPTP